MIFVVPGVSKLHLNFARKERKAEEDLCVSSFIVLFSFRSCNTDSKW